MQPCALAVCAFDAQGLGFLTLAGGLLGRVAFVASWRGPTQPKSRSQVKSSPTFWSAAPRRRRRALLAGGSRIDMVILYTRP